MRRLKLILFLFLTLTACNQVKKDKPIRDLPSQDDSIARYPNVQCILGEEQLDHELRWPSSRINPELNYLNYVLLSAHISSNDNNLGIITMMNKTDSTGTLFFVESIDNSNNYLILGTKNIGKIGKYHTVQSLCTTDCDIETKITGLISFDSDNHTKTIKAWTIDKKNRTLVSINNDHVNCSDAFNNEYD